MGITRLLGTPLGALREARPVAGLGGGARVDAAGDAEIAIVATAGAITVCARAREMPAVPQTDGADSVLWADPPVAGLTAAPVAHAPADCLSVTFLADGTALAVSPAELRLPDGTKLAIADAVAEPFPGEYVAPQFLPLAAAIGPRTLAICALLPCAALAPGSSTHMRAADQSLLVAHLLVVTITPGSLAIAARQPLCIDGRPAMPGALCGLSGASFAVGCESGALLVFTADPSLALKHTWKPVVPPAAPPLPNGICSLAAGPSGRVYAGTENGHVVLLSVSKSYDVSCDASVALAGSAIGALHASGPTVVAAWEEHIVVVHAPLVGPPRIVATMRAPGHLWASVHLVPTQAGTFGDWSGHLIATAHDTDWLSVATVRVCGVSGGKR